jgi:hypothetical protein
MIEAAVLMKAKQRQERLILDFRDLFGDSKGSYLDAVELGCQGPEEKRTLFHPKFAMDAASSFLVFRIIRAVTPGSQIIVRETRSRK